jgi:hypothetical protein
VAGYRCYGRLAVVSDMDNGGFALNVDNEQKVCRAITKQVQWSDAGIKVDRMHTRWMNALSKRRGVY